MTTTDNAHTRQIKQIVAQYGDHRNKRNTLLHDAQSYFASLHNIQLERKKLTDYIDHAIDEEKRENWEKKRDAFEREVDHERLQRLARVNELCTSLLTLTESPTQEDTLDQSAKSLATMLLITQGKTRGFQQTHATIKPIYKAILSLRLSDEVLASGNIKHSYLKNYVDVNSRFNGNRHWQQIWLTGLARPLLKAALFQDIGLQHPDAYEILYGEDENKDPFRVLTEQERKKLLKINYQFSLDYIKNGLGIPGYVGNSREERDAFVSDETQSMNFCIELIKDAFTAKNNLGELIKIPQIYTSFVFSTKRDYSRLELPKGYMVLKQLAEKGRLNKRMTELFLNLVGVFPQGFGIVYVPIDSTGTRKDTYEYAIVNRLRPEKATTAHCRSTTRGLSFVRSGRDVVVERSENLYYQANHQLIKSTNIKRIKEIMSQLSGNFKQQHADDLVPRFWEPHDYFAEKEHQNLWNKS